jgi:L-serine dehydratase
MIISAFELFSIGVGPSSSHTVGPMRATYAFINQLKKVLPKIARITIDLYGSLALTGIGHGTDKAVLMGLEGDLPENIDPFQITARLEKIKQEKIINLLSSHYSIRFDYEQDLRFHKQEFLPRHANALRCTAYAANQEIIAEQTYYSIGGGFILNDSNFDAKQSTDPRTPPLYPFSTAHELIEQCKTHHLTIAELMRLNESTWRSLEGVEKGMLKIAQVMFNCIQNGCSSKEHTLPGGLNVTRRAPSLWAKLQAQGKPSLDNVLNWMNLYALAVNEENAAGGRVVTAPTNGAAGIIPAVLKYYCEFIPNADEKGIVDFLLTAAAIGILYKKNASISAAEVGCQGEIGVACSMSAGALTAVLGGSVDQIEKAAEMGMEHHLGLTCDPIGGLVQVPCIERNAMGTVQAISCAQLVMNEDDVQHKVSLDKVIATMFRTGKDMQSIYKETSLGGLAVNQPEC